MQRLNHLIDSEQFEELFLYIEKYISTEREMHPIQDYEYIGIDNLREIQIFGLLRIIMKTNDTATKYFKLNKLEQFIAGHKITTGYQENIKTLHREIAELTKAEKKELLQQKILKYSKKMDYVNWTYFLQKIDKEDSFRNQQEKQITYKLKKAFSKARRTVLTQPEQLVEALKNILVCKSILTKENYLRFISSTKKLILKHPELKVDAIDNIYRQLNHIPEVDIPLRLPSFGTLQESNIPFEIIQNFSLEMGELIPDTKLPNMEEEYKMRIENKLNNILEELNLKKSIYQQIKEQLFT